MRTTLDIDDDLLAAAKELARRERKSAGKVVSELMRKALTGRTTIDEGDEPENAGADQLEEQAAFYGFRPLPARGRVVTNEDINRLRDELGI